MGSAAKVNPLGRSDRLAPSLSSHRGDERHEHRQPMLEGGNRSVRLQSGALSRWQSPLPQCNDVSPVRGADTTLRQTVKRKFATYVPQASPWLTFR